MADTDTNQRQAYINNITELAKARLQSAVAGHFWSVAVNEYVESLTELPPHTECFEEYYWDTRSAELAQENVWLREIFAPNALPMLNVRRHHGDHGSEGAFGLNNVVDCLCEWKALPLRVDDKKALFYHFPCLLASFICIRLPIALESDARGSAYVDVAYFGPDRGCYAVLTTHPLFDAHSFLLDPPKDASRSKVLQHMFLFSHAYYNKLVEKRCIVKEPATEPVLLNALPDVYTKLLKTIQHDEPVFHSESGDDEYSDRDDEIDQNIQD